MKINGTTHINDLDRKQVEQLQILLNVHGAGLIVDGILGRLTKQAFIDFKIRNNLEYPEHLGEKTLEFLEKPPEQLVPTRINQKGFDLIKEFEGFRENAYICPAGVPTIGWGSTYYEDGSSVKMGDRITRERAEILLENTVASFEKQVADLLKVTVTRSQFSALVSFAFNVGINAFANSTLLKVLNKKDYAEAGRQLLRWNKAEGRELTGLTRRRKAEKVLFEKPG